MKKVTNIILLLLLISGCEFSTEPEMLSYEFMPLKVGNKWNYEISSYSDFTITDARLVTQKKIMNGKEYFEVQRIVNTQVGADTFYIYYRQWENNLFVDENIDSGREIQAADFSLEMNDILLDGEWNRKVVQKDDTSIVFFSDVPTWDDEEYSEKYVKGIGLVEFNNSWGYHIELVNYELK